MDQSLSDPTGRRTGPAAAAALRQPHPPPRPPNG